jgi:hypothetical protein
MFAQIDLTLILLGILYVCLVVVWLCALINCIRRKDLGRSEKIAWVIVILFTNYIGLIAYFIFTGRRNAPPASRFAKALDPVTGKPINHAPL